MSLEVDGIPPHDPAAERALLGSMLCDGRAADIAIECLEPGAFYVPAHGTLFHVFKALLENQSGLDEVSVLDELSRRGFLERLGGRQIIGSLIEETPSAANIERYCRIVLRKERERKVQTAVQKIILNQFDPDAALQALDELGQDASQLVPSGDMESFARPVAANALEGRASVRCFPTGIADGAFDRLVGGGVIQRQFWALMSLPSYGKSTLLNAIARGVRRLNPDAGRPLYITTEMDPTSIATVGLAMEAGVHTRGLVEGNLSPLQQDAVRRAMDKGHLAGVEIQWFSGRSVSALRALARQHKRRHGLPVLIIDLARGLEMKGATRTEATANVSNSLKALPVELDCCVIACTHLNRAHQSENREPTMNDVRDSNAWAEDADKILILHRIIQNDRTYTKVIQDKNRLYRDEAGLVVEFMVATGSYRPVKDLEAERMGS